MVQTAQPKVHEPNPGWFGYPDWFHHHGLKMKTAILDLRKKTLTIEGSAAILTINRIEIAGLPVWHLSWEVRHSLSSKSSGNIVFVDEDLAFAFRIEDAVVEKHSQWIIDRFGGDRASQGKYIGYGDHLNIPCPGTGHDGDPNISILLDEEMVRSVKAFLIK